MSHRRVVASLACFVALAASCSSLGPSVGDAPATPDAESHKQTAQAAAVLQRMSEFLASRPNIRFRADIHYDAVQASGQKIEFGSQRTVAVRRPDRARVEVAHWDGGRELVTFDGRRLSVAMPERGVYASIAYTGGVADALDYLIEEHGVASPLSDLLRRDLPEEVSRRALSARRLEDVTILGASCNHLAFRGERVDFQIFIRQGNEPVPVRLVIDYHGEEGSPQFRAQLRDWSFEAALPDSLFQFAPAAGSQRVGFDELMDLLLGSLEPGAES